MTNAEEQSHGFQIFRRGRKEKEKIITSELVERFDELDQRLTTMNETLEEMANYCARIADHYDRMDETLSLLITSLKGRLTQTDESSTGDMLRTLLGLLFTKQ